MKSSTPVERFRRHKHTIHKLIKCKNKHKACQAIQHANKDFIICLCDCVYNIVNGNVHVKSDTKNKFKKHQKEIYKLLSPTSLNVKKKIIAQDIKNQSGGFYSLIASELLDDFVGED